MGRGETGQEVYKECDGIRVDRRSKGEDDEGGRMAQCLSRKGGQTDY